MYTHYRSRDRLCPPCNEEARRSVRSLSLHLALYLPLVIRGGPAQAARRPRGIRKNRTVRTPSSERATPTGRPANRSVLWETLLRSQEDTHSFNSTADDVIKPKNKPDPYFLFSVKIHTGLQMGGEGAIPKVIF